ncbi:SDR family NAD(P)-dependent oxidoreductase [Parapedobacter sp. ISTM3]|nr:SDR family NAD(P)-dependent oxidoreductase [Parapedobacter sp. ISTM3]
MQVSLNQQRILVTGASRGIGAAIASQLSQAGANVLLHYHKNKIAAQRLKDNLPGDAAWCHATYPTLRP